MHPTAIVNDPSIIGPEFITLVDLDGRPTTPTARPAALDWGPWADVIAYRLGASDEGLDAHRTSVIVGDAMNHVIFRAEQPGKPDFDRAMEQVEQDDPVPDEIPDNLVDPTQPDPDETGEFPPPVPVVDPAEGPGADASAWNLAAFGLAPIMGGAPDYEPYEPTPDDERDYQAWLERTDGGMLPDGPQDLHAGRLSVGMLEAVSSALYGPGALTSAR